MFRKTIDIGYFDDDDSFYVSDVRRGRYLNERIYRKHEFDKLLVEHDRARKVICDPRTAEWLRQARPTSAKIHLYHEG